MSCDACQSPLATMGAILHGNYGQYCRDCRDSAQRQSSPRTASYQREQDRSAHEKDMLQPWVRGKPNTNFIRAYPDKAKDYYSDKELEQYG